MSAVASPSSTASHPPGEADLQELYNQVLAGFAEESPTSESLPKLAINRSDGPRDSPYSPHSDDSQASQAAAKPSRAITQPRPASSPRDNSRPLPSPTMYPQSPTQSRSPRPLPRLPGASPSSSPTYSTHMPEARPYQPEIGSPPSPNVRTNGDIPRRQYPGDVTNGAVPPVPPKIPLSSERHAYRGLPSDPRPANRAVSTLRPGSSSAGTPSPTQVIGHTRQANSMQYSMPIPETATESSYTPQWGAPSGGRNGLPPSDANFQRQPSVRPAGASAPRIPGFSWQSDGQDDSFRPTAAPSDSYTGKVTSTSTSSGSSYFSGNSQSSYSPTVLTPSIPPPPPLPHATLSVPARSSSRANLERASFEDILVPGTEGFARPLSKFLQTVNGLLHALPPQPPHPLHR
ncbi:hypothetical protein BV25DRAFT_1173578 [Artomyces pyxidatus]|uniref:Uncharacterized protein n=1 Tax=Artomyces pyxidatus TaxID=48021 RepID=A0ACB8SRU1_9AGAM|nr:hypothetical protein BV25DRAFT_1173578 [Artomyces pyxidatus]